ncbi:MAG: aminoglycoside phosphotransferase family protein [Pirellulales bacterium]|nr:aminoglycoside phosphotransferase family protein [Pirellulales bacterium]
MEVIDAGNAEAYLRRQGWIARASYITVESLAGGVSNEVLYIRFVDGSAADFVVKQARPQLRTADPWFCSTERIWREVEVLRVCHGVTNRTPEILREDRENHLFAMTAAPREHRVWKADLLAGEFDRAIATACGRLLGQLHAGTWQDADVARRLEDRRYFDELRLDPYYRQVARNVPDVRDAFERLIASVLKHRHSLVHADFSPKNLLVWSTGLMLVDFETGHYGDPAFDLGFFLSHLVLKAFYRAPRHEAMLMLIEGFLEQYAQQIQPRVGQPEYEDLIGRGVQNLAGCAWARLDGKSKIEYLTDESKCDAVRALCRDTLGRGSTTWGQFRDELASQLARVS